MLCVLVLASGAEWESEALASLNVAPGLVVLKRCVDVSDLMGAATTGQADIALVAIEAPGLDTDAVDHLRRHRVRAIGVDSGTSLAEDRARARRLGMVASLGAEEMARLAEVITAGADDDVAIEAASLASTTADEGPDRIGSGRVLVVWGPYGAPGRTTVAVGLATELARRRQHTVLVDADPWGGSIAQHLGVLDEVSGVLAGARLAATGDLPDRFASIQRRLGEHLTVVTGLPRPDRWSEVRAGTIEHVAELAAQAGHVVLDTGFSIEDENTLDLGSRPTRNAMTLGALSCAEETVVVGSADPVGLARLARGLTDLSEVSLDSPVRVVINRMRSTLGWSEREIIGMVQGFARVRSIHFLPEDRGSVDHALVSGGPLTEGPLTRAISGLVDDLFPESQTPVKGRGLRKKTTGRARLG